MAVTASPVFEFSTDGGSTWKPSDAPLTGSLALASSGSPIAVKARLSSLAGVHTVVWSVPTADELTIDGGYAGVTAVQASDKSVTLTFPGTAGRAYVLQAAVNGSSALLRRLAVHVKTSNNLEVLSAGEYDEANRTHGWTGMLNAAIRAVSAGGGGGGVTQVGGATQSGGVITFTSGGSTGIITTPSGNDVAFRVGVTSQAAGDLIKATSGTAWARQALGSADALLGVNGAGTDVAYTSTPWLAGMRLGLGGSTAADVVGTGTLQVKADASGGQALTVEADATAGGHAAFYSSAEVLKGRAGYDEANDRMVLRADGVGLRVSTDAAETMFPIVLEGGNENVGLCGATAFGGGVDIVSIGGVGTPPSSVPATAFFLSNAAGTGRIYAGATVSVHAGLTERLRVTTAVVGTGATNTSLGSLAGSFGGGVLTVFIANATTLPTTNPTGGGVLYVNSGALTYRGSGGTVSVLAPALSGEGEPCRGSTTTRAAASRRRSRRPARRRPRSARRSTPCPRAASPSSAGASSWPTPASRPRRPSS